MKIENFDNIGRKIIKLQEKDIKLHLKINRLSYCLYFFQNMIQ